jgi:hypothetical protein
MRPIVLLALAAGCSGYDPDLSPTPFLCGDSDPKCPSGYECQTIGSQDICISGEVLNPDGTLVVDNPPSACPLDGTFEPNDTYQTAFTTNAFTAPIEYGPVEICPASDKDHYRIVYPAGAMKSLRVKVTWEGSTAPTGAVLNGGGNVLENLVSSGSNEISGCSENLPAASGPYFAQVQASAKVVYNIALSVTDDCGM